ncbi:hypothetical protein APSETT444_001913 [Aspergillus pseudonomiae]
MAGVPLGVYNIADNFNIALQVQPNILICLSLVTWSQCKYYGDNWRLKKIVPVAIAIGAVLGGAEAGLVFALRVAFQRGQKWPSTLMAILSAVLLAAGVLRHYVDMFRTRSDAGLSLKFALLDASGDVASILSVIFQPSLSILGLAIYGTEFVIWLGLMIILLYFRAAQRRKARDIRADGPSDAASGQALAQSATGNYLIGEGDKVLTLNDSRVVFNSNIGADSQIWGFNTVGPSTVVIQNQGSGDYLNCDESGSPCSTSGNPQVFEPIKRSQDLYQIRDESGDLFLAESSDETAHLVEEVQPDEYTIFTLTRPATECELQRAPL